MEVTVPDSEIGENRLQGLTFCSEEGENEWTTGSTAGSLDSHNLVCIEGDDCVNDELMQIPSYFIPDTFDPDFIHGNHYCAVCETYPIVGIRLHCQHFKPSQGSPGEGCCHHCFEELFKGGDRAKREQWLISFEPEQLESDGPLQSKYREKFFALDEQDQSDKENEFQNDTNRDEYERSSPFRIFSRKRNEKVNGENDKTAEESYMESPDRKNAEIHAGEKQSIHILGTSSRDLLAHPLVLSPSLMESLLCFVPECISSENFWLKYSLVRDGASLNTLQNFTRASSNTIIAIQTTGGDVFGSFTSSPWQIKKGSFGNGESFVWKMQHNRMAGSSIHETAQQERKIQVFPNSILNDSVQICTNDMIGVGGASNRDTQIGEEIHPNVKEEQALSFAFLLHSDLCRGTTFSSATFCSPRLCSEEDGIFEVLNLEVWAFTPCSKVDNAERLELKTYLRQNPRGLASYHSAFALRRPDRKLGDGEFDKNIFNLESLPAESDEDTDITASVLSTSGKKRKSDSIGLQDGDTLQAGSKFDAIEMEHEHYESNESFEDNESDSGTILSNNLTFQTSEKDSLRGIEEFHTSIEVESSIENSAVRCDINDHGNGKKDNKGIQKKSGATSFCCCNDTVDSDGSAKERNDAHISILKGKVVEDEDFNNISGIEGDDEGSNIDLSGDFSDFTVQTITDSSIEVSYSDREEECTEGGLEPLIGCNTTPEPQSRTLDASETCNQDDRYAPVPIDRTALNKEDDEFHECQESSDMNESSLSQSTVGNEMSLSFHTAKSAIQTDNQQATPSDSFRIDSNIERTHSPNDISSDFAAAADKYSCLKADGTPHSFDTSGFCVRGIEVPEKADFANGAAAPTKLGQEDDEKVKHDSDMNFSELFDTSNDFMCDGDKADWTEFPDPFATPEKYNDNHGMSNEDDDTQSPCNVFGTPCEFLSGDDVAGKTECTIDSTIGTSEKHHLVLAISPMLTPENKHLPTEAEIKSVPLENQTVKSLIFTRQQKETVEKFCADVKIAPIEVLKLNREHKWQKRFLTVSKERAYEEEDPSFCPLALLWVKKVFKSSEYSASNIDKHGRGGLVFSRMLRVSLERESDASTISPLSKQQRKKSLDSVVVTIDYESGNSETSGIQLLCPREAGENIVSSCSAIIDAMAHSRKENPLLRSRFVSMDESVECGDTPNFSVCSSPKQLDPSPLGIESHPYQKSNPMWLVDGSCTSDEDEESIIPKRLFKEVTELRASVKQYSKNMNEDLGKQNENILELETNIQENESQSKSRIKNLELSLRASETSLLEKSGVIQDLQNRLVDSAEFDQLLEAAGDVVAEKSHIITNLEERLATASKLREKLDEASEIIAEKSRMITGLNNGLAEALELRRQLDDSKLELEDKSKVIDHLEQRMAISSELQIQLKEANVALSEKREVIEKMEKRLTSALEFENKFNECSATLLERKKSIKELEERLELTLEAQKQLEESNAKLSEKNASIRDLEERLTMASNFQRQLEDSNDLLAEKNTNIDGLEKRLELTLEVSEMLDAANVTLSEKSKMVIVLQDKLDLIAVVQEQLDFANATLLERNRTITDLEGRLTRSSKRESELSELEAALSEKSFVVQDLVGRLELASNIQKQLDNAHAILSEKGSLIAGLEKRLIEALKLETQLNSSQEALSEKTDLVTDLEERLALASEMETKLNEAQSHLREKRAFIGDLQERLANAMLTEKTIDEFQFQLNEKSGIVGSLQEQLTGALEVRKELDDTNAILSEKSSFIKDLEERLTNTVNLQKQLGESNTRVIEQSKIIKELEECVANASDLKERLIDAKSSLSEKTIMITNLENRLTSAAVIQKQLDLSAITLLEKCSAVEALESRLASTLLLEGQLEQAHASLSEKCFIIEDLEKRASKASELGKELDETKSTLSAIMLTICSLEKRLEDALGIQKQLDEANDTLSDNCLVISNLEQRLQTASVLKKELDAANTTLSQNRNFIADLEQRLSVAVLLEKQLDEMSSTLAEKTKDIKFYEEQLQSASEVQKTLDDSNGKVPNLEKCLTEAIAESKSLREEICGLVTERELQKVAISEVEEKAALLSQEKDETVGKMKADSCLKENQFMKKIFELEERVSLCKDEMNRMEVKLSQAQEDGKTSSVIIAEKQMSIQELESKLTEMAEVQKAGEKDLKFDLAEVEESLRIAKSRLEELTVKAATIETDKVEKLAELEEQKSSIAQDLGLEIGRLKSVVACSNEENVDLHEKLCEYEAKEDALVTAIHDLKAATETVKANLELKRNQISEMTVSSNDLKDRIKRMHSRTLKVESERDSLSKKLNNANKINANLEYDVEVLHDEKEIAEKEHEEYVQNLQSEKDEIADELSSAIRLGMELDNAMEKKRSEVAKLAIHLEMQNNALNAATVKIEELLKAQEALNSSNADNEIMMESMEEQEKLLRAEITQRKHEIDSMTNTNAADKRKISYFQSELNKYEEKVGALSEQAVKVGNEHEMQLIKSKEEMQVMHDAAVRLLRDELDQQRKVVLLQAAESASAELRQVQEEGSQRLKIAIQAIEEANREKIERESNNVFDSTASLPGGLQNRVLWKCILLILTCTIVGKVVIGSQKLQSSVSSRINEYEQHTLDMKQKLRNIVSQADDDHLEVVTIMREAMNHEVGIGLESLEAKRIGVLERLEGLGDDSFSPAESISSIVAIRLFSDYLTSVLSSYAELTDEYSKTKEELEKAIAENTGTSNLKQKLRNLNVKHTQEKDVYESKIAGVEATLDVFRRRNTDLESKLGDCSAEGIAKMREIENLKYKLSKLERGNGAKDQEKIDEIRYLRLRLELSEKERKEAASCTESRALIIPEKRSRGRFGKVVRDTMTEVFGEKPLQNILRDTLLINANANMLLN